MGRPGGERGDTDCCDFKAGQVEVRVPWTRALRFLLRCWHPARAELPRVSPCPHGAWGHAHQWSWFPGPQELGQASQPLRRQQGPSSPIEGNSFFPGAVRGRCAAGHLDAGPRGSPPARVPQLPACAAADPGAGRGAEPTRQGSFWSGSAEGGEKGTESGSSSKATPLACWLFPARGSGNFCGRRGDGAPRRSLVAAPCRPPELSAAPGSSSDLLPPLFATRFSSPPV